MGKDKLEIEVTADDKASSVLKGVGGALGGLGKVAGTALTATAGLAITGLGALGASAIATNATLETSTLQFETLLGSTDAAKEHIAGLYEFAAKTPFETEPIIAASKSFETFGGAALDTQDNLLRVGNAAAVTGESIDGVAFWVGRAYNNIQSGKPFGEAAARLQEMGILTGDARNELEEMQKAGASTDEIWGNLIGQFDRFDGAMEKQANTWEGLTSTIMDNLNLAVGSALKPFFESLKDVVGVVAEFVQTDEFNAAIEDIGNQLAPLAENFGQMATELMTTVGPALFDGVIMPLIELAATAGPPVMELLGVLLEAFSGLSGLLVGQLSESFVGLTEVLLPALSDILPPVSQILATTAAAFFGILEAVTPLIPPLMELASSILRPLADIFTSVVISATPFVNDIVATLIPLISELQTTLQPIVSTILVDLARVFTQVIKAIGPLLEMILPPLVDLFLQVITALLPLIDDVFPMLVDLVLQIIQAFAPLVAEILPIVAELMVALIDAIIPLIEEILPVLIEFVMNVIDAFLPVIEEILPVAAELFLALIEAIAPLIEALFPVLVELLDGLITIITPLLDALMPLFVELMTALKNAIQEAMPYIEDFAGWIEDHVVPAVKGVSDAISEAVGWIADFAAGLVDLVLPDFLVSHSPTPFEIGLRGISSAMRELTTGELPAFGSGLDQLSYGGSMAISSQGSTAPVQLVINYQPLFSTVDQDEVANKIRPLINRIIRDYNRGVK